MQKVTSKDGTEIAFEKSGEGPALIIVGGSLADHQFYAPLANELGRVDKRDSQISYVLIQGSFGGGCHGPGFVERQGMGLS